MIERVETIGSKKYFLRITTEQERIKLFKILFNKRLQFTIKYLTDNECQIIPTNENKDRLISFLKEEKIEIKEALSNTDKG